MQIYTKKEQSCQISNYHPGLIWNNGALGFFGERRPNKKNKQKNNNKMNSYMGSVPAPKSTQPPDFQSVNIDTTE